MVAPSRTDRSRLRPLLWLAAVVVALVIFPPVRFRPIESPNPGHAATAESPQRFALSFWEQTLTRREPSAVELADLWSALGQDPSVAMEKYGQRASVGARPVFLVRGEATVTSIDERGVWISLARKVEGNTVLLNGPVFGNQVRDATGLINIADFDSFEFNAISAELNRLVETNVQPELRRLAVVGAHLELFGAAEVDDASSERLILKIVPIRVSSP